MSALAHYAISYYLSPQTNEQAKRQRNFGCNTSYGTCVVSGLATLKGQTSPSSANKSGSRNVQANEGTYRAPNQRGDSV